MCWEIKNDFSVTKHTPRDGKSGSVEWQEREVSYVLMFFARWRFDDNISDDSIFRQQFDNTTYEPFQRWQIWIFDEHHVTNTKLTDFSEVVWSRLEQM